MASKLTVSNITFDPGIIGDQEFSNSSSRRLDADKVQHVYKGGTAFGFAIGATPTTREEIVYVASQPGTIRGFHALLNVDGSSTSITFDLKKNGTTVLTGVVTITDATGDRVIEDGTLSSASFAAGDVFSIAMTVTSSTGAQGPYAWAEFEESAAP